MNFRKSAAALAAAALAAVFTLSSPPPAKAQLDMLMNHMISHAATMATQAAAQAAAHAAAQAAMHAAAHAAVHAATHAAVNVGANAATRAAIHNANIAARIAARDARVAAHQTRLVVRPVKVVVRGKVMTRLVKVRVKQGDQDATPDDQSADQAPEQEASADDSQIPVRRAGDPCKGVVGNWTANGLWNGLFQHTDLVLRPNGSARDGEGTTGRWSCRGGHFVMNWNRVSYSDGTVSDNGQEIHFGNGRMMRGH
jgi:hypothetical protein